MPKRILIIEDSPVVGGILKDVFEGEGYEVDLVENGELGVAQVANNPPDLVITDTLLPGMDGFEVCRRIRESLDSSSIKVIIITGSVDAVDAVQAKKMGADDYCVKTSDFSHLIGAVENLI